MRVDMEFLFEYLTPYLRTKGIERVRYQVEQEKKNSISQAAIHYSVYYINKLMTTFWTIFQGFRTLYFISKDSPKVVRRPEYCFSGTFAKIS